MSPGAHHEGQRFVVGVLHFEVHRVLRRAELRQGNVTSLPYADGKFDKAFAVNVHYFWEDPLAALRETKRVLKPGGRMALGFIDKEGFKKQEFTQTGGFTLYNGH